MSELKILNTYKLIILFESYIESYGVTARKVNNALIRKTLADKFIKAGNFSELDDGLLEIINAKLNSYQIDVKRLESYLTMMKKDGVLPKQDNTLLEKLGFKKKNVELDEKEIQESIKRVFPTHRFATGILGNFKQDVKSEIERRKSKSNKLVGGKGLSVDNSLLMVYKKKLGKCKSFDDIEDLFLYYTTARGCDLINGFLRGDLTLFKSKAKIASSWGTSKEVSVDLLIDTAIKALELKEQLMFGTLDNVVTVYRGLGLEGLLKFIGISKESLVSGQSWLQKWFNKLKSLIGKKEKSIPEMLVSYINDKKPIYKTNAITSTSLDQNLALTSHASRNKIPVLMTIQLKKGTAFGKDFRDTKFGFDDYNKEVILKSGQKIKLIKAKLKKHSSEPDISIQCETIN